MAFTLSCHIVERNDNRLLTISDTTGGCSQTSWGVGTNPTVSGISLLGAGTPLTLTIKIITSDNLENTYDTLDLKALFFPSGATVYDELVFPITASMLKKGGVAMNASGDNEFPDGIYEITYAYGEPDSPIAYVTNTVLIDGKVSSDIYQLLRTIPMHYDDGYPHEKDTLDVIFLRTYLNAMHVSAYVARKDSLLIQLKTIERLLHDVSTYTW